MGDFFKAVGILIVALALIIGSYFFGFGIYKYFAPKYENARREVFENTRSYNEGKFQDLVKYRLEYMQASEEEKPILASTIRHMFANYDEERLPDDLLFFLRDIKRGDL